MKTEHQTDPATAVTGGHDCTCGGCSAEDLPVDPFVALRVSQGMLLGVDDFHVLTGTRAASTCCTRPGCTAQASCGASTVVRTGEYGLTGRPGLALDGLGRDLVLTGSRPVDVKDWLGTTTPTSASTTAGPASCAPALSSSSPAGRRSRCRRWPTRAT